MMPIPQSAPNTSIFGTIFGAIIILVYFIVICIIAVDVIKTKRRSKDRHPHKLTYDDYQKILDDGFTSITLPIWANVSLGEFNTVASSYYQAFEKMLAKNREYVKALHDMNKDDPDYTKFVEAEYIIIGAMSQLAAELCSKFNYGLRENPLGHSQCPHVIVQKYCLIVNCFRAQRESMEKETFIPPELKSRYLAISDALFSLFDLLNSNIEVF